MKTYPKDIDSLERVSPEKLRLLVDPRLVEEIFDRSRTQSNIETLRLARMLGDERRRYWDRDHQAHRETRHAFLLGLAAGLGVSAVFWLLNTVALW